MDDVCYDVCDPVPAYVPPTPGSDCPDCREVMGVVIPDAVFWCRWCGVLRHGADGFVPHVPAGRRANQGG